MNCWGPSQLVGRLLGLTVYRGGWYVPNGDDPQQQVRVFHDHVMIGWTQEPHRCPGEREYCSVEYTDREGLMYGPTYPGGGMPADPIAAHREAQEGAR